MKSQIVHTVTVNVPKEVFDNYVAELAERIYFDYDEGLEALGLTNATLASHPGVIAAFQKACEAVLVREDYHEGVVEQAFVDYPKVFKTEIKAAKEAEAKAAAEAKKAREAERKKLEAEGVHLVVKASKAERARALLEAAGLI